MVVLLGAAAASCGDESDQATGPEVYVSSDAAGALRQSVAVTAQENLYVVVRFPAETRSDTVRITVAPITIAGDSKYQALAAEPLGQPLRSGDKTTGLVFPLRRETPAAAPTPPAGKADPVVSPPVEPWPTGSFRVEAFAAEASLGVTQLKIVWSECPGELPTVNAPCRDYLPRLECVYGQFPEEKVAEPTQCVCDEHVAERKWACQPTTL